MHALRRRVIALLLVASLSPVASGQLTFPEPSSGQQQSVDPVGFDFTQFLFQLSGLEFVRLRTSEARPRESIVVALGTITPQQQLRLSRFVERGGRVLIATDRATLGNIVAIPAERIVVRDPAVMYQRHEDCFHVPVREHDLTRGVGSIVVNRASRIAGLRNWGTWETLATHPTPAAPRLAAALERGIGRAVVIADHSPFTNDMLMRGHNAAFTMNIVEWLADGNRRRVTFLIDTREAQAPNILPMLPPDNIPPIDPDDIPNDTKIAIANRFLREVQKANALNQYLAAIPAAKYWRWIILIPTLLLGWRVVSRLLSSERSVVRPPDLHAANASEARTADMIRSGSMRAVARELSRGFLRTLTGSPNDSDWALDRRRIIVSPGVSGSPRRIRSDVEMLSRLAVGTERRRMNRRGLRKLARRIDELTRLHSTGQLRFQPLAATT